MSEKIQEARMFLLDVKNFWKFSKSHFNSKNDWIVSLYEHFDLNICSKKIRIYILNNRISKLKFDERLKALPYYRFQHLWVCWMHANI